MISPKKTYTLFFSFLRMEIENFKDQNQIKEAELSDSKRRKETALTVHHSSLAVTTPTVAKPSHLQIHPASYIGFNLSLRRLCMRFLPF